MAINYKSLILETSETPKTIEKKAPTAKKKPEIIYTIEGVSGPDMVVTKKTPRKEEQFIMLMSQGQVYIKDIKTDTINMCDADLIFKFFNDLENPLVCVDKEGNKLNWTSTFYKGMVFARTLEAIIKSRYIGPYINRGLIYVDLKDVKAIDIIDRGNSYDLKTIQTVYNLTPDRLKNLYISKFSKKVLLRYEGNDYSSDNRFSLDNTKINSLLMYCRKKKSDPNNDIIDKKYGFCGFTKIIEEYFNTAVTSFPDFNELNRLFSGSGGYKYGNSTHKFEFDLQSFIRYLFYSSVEQGYATQINNFIELWKDTLVMQDHIFKHGIEEKYPEYLGSYHQILCYKYDLLKQQIDEAKWGRQVERMSKYERHGEVYSIICPKTPNDMLNEARQQSNCLSSYVNNVINGTCMIFFLRKTKDINTSLVTIEIRENGSLGQVKAKYNREPNEEEREYVQKWYYEKVTKLFKEEL